MTKPRALLVEDEVLVSMMMEDVLNDMGWDVVGNFSNVAPTLNWLAQGEGVDAALLDINLGTETVFPVAHALKAKGTPFAFVTGYTTLAEAQSFDMPILTKPVDLTQLERVLAGFRPA